MTGPRNARASPPSEALAFELVDKLCTPSKLVVREELAMVAARLNVEFLACESVAGATALADAVFHHHPAVITAIHNAIQDGDACVHIVLELGYHLTHSASACDAVCQAGIVETLVGVLPMLTAVPAFSALQLLDHITDGTGDDTLTSPLLPTVAPSSGRDRGRRLAVQRLCRVACVRVLWNVLAADRSSSPLGPLLTGPALSLLCKITAAVETARWAGSRSAMAVACQQIIKHTLERLPPVETTLRAQLLGEDGDHGGQRHGDPLSRETVGQMLATVLRWRGSATGTALR